MENRNPTHIAVVIPAYRVKEQILQVLHSIGKEVQSIYVVDDCCPEQSGHHVMTNCRDSRVKVLFHDMNQGVGGATITGYRQALEDGADVIVKLDGDGQMDPALIPVLIRPVTEGDADYAKGNRFYSLDQLAGMPLARLLGNAVLSFMSKFSTGYWHLFDPTNGFTAIHAAVAGKLLLEKLERRYFFESDILFRLNILRAVVIDIHIGARYGDEMSSLRIWRVIPEFIIKHMRNVMKRIFYNYFLRDFSVASIELLCGMLALTFGIIFGSYAWYMSVSTGIVASSGTVMLAGLPALAGLQLILAFLSADCNNVPNYPLHKQLQCSTKH